MYRFYVEKKKKKIMTWQKKKENARKYWTLCKKHISILNTLKLKRQNCPWKFSKPRPPLTHLSPFKNQKFTLTISALSLSLAPHPFSLQSHCLTLPPEPRCRLSPVPTGPAFCLIGTPQNSLSFSLPPNQEGFLLTLFYLFSAFFTSYLDRKSVV